uniref:KIB1-4 beta-propeller domain-containing protein n=1 Tax=Oryza barthii TaxID=65489 RepID=A0A0D3HJV8_9ORYZ
MPPPKNKAKKAAAASGGGGERDRIGALPDEVLHHILSFLQAQGSVRTCVLGRPWRHLWKSPTGLRLRVRSRTPPGVLLLRGGAPLDACEISFSRFDGDDQPRAKLWIRHSKFQKKIVQKNPKFPEISVLSPTCGRNLNFEISNPVISHARTPVLEKMPLLVDAVVDVRAMSATCGDFCSRSDSGDCDDWFRGCFGIQHCANSCMLLQRLSEAKNLTLIAETKLVLIMRFTLHMFIFTFLPYLHTGRKHKVEMNGSRYPSDLSAAVLEYLKTIEVKCEVVDERATSSAPSPDAVLSLLPAQEAVRTCVLARRWRHLNLEACASSAPATVEKLHGFVHHLLLLRGGSGLPSRHLRAFLGFGWHVSMAALVACSSRRRRLKANAGDPSSSWASLHEDLVSLIGWRVAAGDFRDYIRFRAVCPQSTGAVVRVRLPQFRDHCVLYSADGVLLLQRDHDTAVRLLHPFTGDTAELPPLETLLPRVRCRSEASRWCSLRNICGASISVGVGDGLVRVMMRPIGVWNICFATSGDQQWRVATTWDRINHRSSTLPFHGKLYVLLRPHSVRGEHEVIQIDPPQNSISEPSPKLIAKFKWTTSDESFRLYSYRLVECNSEILVIGTKWDAVYYSVYRLADLMLGRTVHVTSIDGNALFIGMRSLCVSSKAFPTIVPDTIVMPDTKIYLSQYHLSNGTLSQATDGVIAEEKDIPGPYSIMCHIITCCSPPYWNKGKISCKELPTWRVKKKFRFGVSLTYSAMIMLYFIYAYLGFTAGDAIFH